MLQVDNFGKEVMLEFRAKNDEMFNTMKKGEQVEVKLDITERDWQGKKFVVVDVA